MSYQESDLEKKSSAFLNMFYESLNGIVMEDPPQSHFDGWDKIVKIGDFVYKMEEKAFNTVWDSLLVELIEDLKTGDLGWFYQTKADKIIYSFYENKNSTKPRVIYALSVDKMRKYVFDHFRELISKSGISDKGYGITLFVTIPLKLANRIYPKPRGELHG